MDTPGPAQIMKNPIGPNVVKIGMTKARVLSLYGEPDIKSSVRSAKWAGEREEWFYSAELKALPVSADYLADDLYLYFDGDNLTNISKVALGKTSEDIRDAGEETIK